MQHLAGGTQGAEGVRQFFGLHQQVGPVQQQAVEVVGLQRAQAVVQPVAAVRHQRRVGIDLALYANFFKNLLLSW